MGLEDGSGRWVSQPAEMLQVASKHFSDLFTASEAEGDNRLLGLVEQQISNSMNAELIRPFTEDEIGQVVKSMAPLKAPGIDGFPALFYQRFWHIVGANISTYCLAILRGEIDMSTINKTHCFSSKSCKTKKLVSISTDQLM